MIPARPTTLDDGVFTLTTDVRTSTDDITEMPFRFILVYMSAVAVAILSLPSPFSPLMLDVPVVVVVVVVVPPLAACAEVVVTVPLRPRCRSFHGLRRRPHSLRNPSRNLDDIRLYRIGLRAELMYNMMRLKNRSR